MKASQLIPQIPALSFNDVRKVQPHDKTIKKTKEESFEKILQPRSSRL